MEETEVKAKVAELRARYSRLAWECRAAGIRVSPQTVDEYAKELQNLQKLIN